MKDDKVQAALVSIVDMAMMNKGELFPTRQRPDFWGLYSKASTDTLTNEELASFQSQVQRAVALNFFTVEQAAAWLGLSVQGVRYHINVGNLKVARPGRDLMISYRSARKLRKKREGLST